MRKLENKDLLWMLGTTLVLVRSSETVERAQAYADIFHNVPSSVNNGHETAETYRRMLLCAERYGLDDWLNRMRDDLLSKQQP